MKRYKPQKIAVLLILCVLLSLTAPAGAISIDGQLVIYTILNDDLMELNYDTMPYMDNGTGIIYVPYTVFTGSFKINSLYNQDQDTLILGSTENTDKTLYYNLKNNTSYDDEGNEFTRTAIWYNRQVYIPAELTARFFDLTYAGFIETKLTSKYDIFIVRIRTPRLSHSDSYIKDFYAADFVTRLDAYVASRENADPVEDDIPAPFYIMFAGGLNEYTSDILDILKKYNLKSVFFIDAESITEREDLVRRIYVDGHVIGVAAGNSVPLSADELINNYELANLSLRRVLRTKSHITYIPGGDKTYSPALSENGYMWWDFSIIANDLAAYATGKTVSDEIIAGLIKAELTQVVVMHSNAAAAAALPVILDFAIEKEISVMEADMLTEPVKYN